MIIKNQSPPPLSVSPPLPLPSPTPSPEPHRHHINQSALTPPCVTPNKSHRPPQKDMPHVMVSRINGRICSKNRVILQDPEEEESTIEENIFTATNQSSSTAEISAANSVSSSLSRHVTGPWCEEEKAYPLKKRRVTFERLLSQEKTNNNNNNKNVIKGAVNSGVEKNSAKKGRNESMVMEGLMRCNRKNGKGWWCRQQRLAGYTMCKYHVKMRMLRTKGQGRISRSESITEPKKVKDFCDDDDDDDDEEDGEGFLVVKERKRIGVVKARSMSSLLRQTVPLLPVSTL